MPRSLHQLALSLLAASLTAHAQTPAAPPYANHNLILLDPAHGGQDAGPNLNGQPEKNITLTLGASLRTALTNRGFIVVSTRDTDLPDNAPALTTDQRAGTANHLRPAACIILHASASGSGIHLTTSALTPTADPSESATTLPWETAQTAYVPLSVRLANYLGLALLRNKIPVLLTRTALRPLDNLTCPAIALELAPLPAKEGKATPVTDTAYQQRVAETLAAALLTWRDLTWPRPAPKPSAPPAAPTPAAAGGATP